MFGTPEWCEMEEGPAKWAAVVRAAECWLTELEDSLACFRAECLGAAHEAKVAEDAAYVRNRDDWRRAWTGRGFRPDPVIAADIEREWREKGELVRSPENPWARHYQSVWHERTADDRMPLWLRVAFLAFGSHRANGHARFKPGEIAEVFGSVDAETGEIKSKDKHEIQRAIRNAVTRGWLADRSRACAWSSLRTPSRAASASRTSDARCTPVGRGEVVDVLTADCKVGHSVTHPWCLGGALT